MSEAARLACSYVEGLDKSAFLADRRTQQAVIMNLIVIGEAATRLLNSDAQFLDAHPSVPWKQMKGMRNRIAHGYFEINVEIVWETVKLALPELIALLPPILAAARASSEGTPANLRDPSDIKS